MSHYRGKIAVITGAGSGIGRALAQQLARQGCHLALSDVSEAGLEQTVASIDSDDLRIHVAILDVSDRIAVGAYASQLSAEFGAVDILFNNAGIAGRHRRIEDYEYSDYEKILDVNLWGTIHCTHEILPLLLRAQSPHLVNFSSIFGLVTTQNCGAYAASKFAVRGYTESLQTEFADSHLSVSCLHPGIVATTIATASDAPAHVVGAFSDQGITPEQCADIILRKVARRQRRIRITSLAFILDYVQRLFPSSYRRITGPLLKTE
jgi:NAD(P)-dependent dehydrogenase (short-subunit alcohol dehydrogenase family)